MEKTIVFLPIILFFGFFALLVGAFLFLVFKLINKLKNMTWTGTLIDKKVLSNKDFDSNRIETNYMLLFKTDEGKEIKSGATKQMFEEFNIGDRAEKIKGQLYPKKL